MSKTFRWSLISILSVSLITVLVLSLVYKDKEVGVLTEVSQKKTVETYSLGVIDVKDNNTIGVKDLGRITKGEVIKGQFYLKNDTSEPLVILDVNGACGCLKFEYDKTPLKPNEIKRVNFTYDTKTKSGTQFSGIKIKTNKKAYQVRLECEVK